MPLVFTPQMKKRLTPRVMQMIEASLREFPELKEKTLMVGYTRSYLGTAFMPARVGGDVPMGIRLRARSLAYNTIGHELTHLVQGLGQVSHKRRSRSEAKIPGGEKQCDIWTLARSALFCDDAPTYLRLPRVVRENWPRYAESIRFLCIAAIEKRQTHRFYIRWLERQIRLLARGVTPEIDLSREFPSPKAY